MEAMVFVILLTAVFLAGIGGIPLVGQNLKYRHLENQPGGSDTGELTDAMASLNENVSRLEAQVADLAERLDFNERLLAERAGEEPPGA